MRILVLNAGSSTLKASVLDTPRREPVATETVDWGADATKAEDRDAGVQDLLGRLVVSGVPIGSIEAVGHRVVHGGPRFHEPVLVDDAIIADLDALTALAPLHNPVAIETIRVARRAVPDVPHVACFDTAFHAMLEPVAYRYPVPDQWFVEWGVRRYGFHGLSVAWSVRRAGELLDRDPVSLRLVVAHLGSGCSVTAVDGSRSVATSMGMTPLEGLMMGTRAGSIDPGIMLGLLQDGHRTTDELAEDLDHRSGLLAIGGTSDMRALLDAADGGDDKASLAIEMFVRRAGEGIAAAATNLPALDALVFTGGIGEHAGSIRVGIVQRLALLGIASVPADDTDDDARLSPAGASPAVLRIAAREDVIVAEATARLAEG